MPTQHAVESPQSPPGTLADGCVKTYEGIGSLVHMYPSVSTSPPTHTHTHTDQDGNVPYIAVSQEMYIEHSAPITHAKFSPNATRVATVDTDGCMRQVLYVVNFYM